MATGSSASQASRNIAVIQQIAQRTGSSLEAVGDVFARVQRSTRELGATSQQVAQATETIQQSFRLAGASTQEAASAALQLGQGLASGRLQGDELRSILENNAVLAQTIAREFGVGIGQLRRLGAEGALTSERVFQAILNDSMDINRQFQLFGNLFGQSFTRIFNVIGLFSAEIGTTIDQIFGINNAIRSVTDGIVARFTDGTLRLSVRFFIQDMVEQFAIARDQIYDFFGDDLFADVSFDDVFASLRAIYGLRPIAGIGTFGIAQAVRVVSGTFRSTAAVLRSFSSSLRALTLSGSGLRALGASIRSIVGLSDQLSSYNRSINGLRGATQGVSAATRSVNAATLSTTRFSQSFAAVIARVSRFANGILGAITRIPGLTPILRTVGAVGRVAGRLFPFINAVFAVVDGISTAFDDDAVREILGLPSDSRITGLDRLLGGISGAINGFIGAIDTGLSFLLEQAGLQASSDSLSELAGTIQTTVNDVLRLVRNFIGAVDNVIGRIIEFFTGRSEELEGDSNVANIDSLISSGLQLINSFFLGIGEAIRTLNAVFEGDIMIDTSMIIENVRAFVTSIPSLIAGAVIGVVDTISMRIVESLDNIGLDQTSDATEGLFAEITRAISNVSTIVTGFLNTIFNTINRVIGFFTGREVSIEQSPIIEIIDTTLSTIVNVITGFFRVINSTLEFVASFFQTPEDIENTEETNRIQDFVNGVGRGVRAIFELVRGTLEGLNTILDAFTLGAVSTITETIVDGISLGVVFIVDTVNAGLEAVSAILDTFSLTAITDAVSTTLTSIRNAVFNIPTIVINALGTLVMNLTGFSLGDIVTGFTETFNNIRNRVVGVRDAITDRLQQFQDAVAGFIIDSETGELTPAIMGLVDGISSFFNRIRSIFSVLDFSTYEDSISSTFDLLQSAIQPFIDGVVGVIDFVTGTINRITERFSSIANLFRTAEVSLPTTEQLNAQNDLFEQARQAARRNNPNLYRNIGNNNAPITLDINELLSRNQDGGRIRGPGTGTSDSIVARLSNGEFVVNARATSQFLPLLEAINSGSIPGFNRGGLAGLPRFQFGGAAADFLSSSLTSSTRADPRVVAVLAQIRQQEERLTMATSEGTRMLIQNNITNNVRELQNIVSQIGDTNDMLDEVVENTMPSMPGGTGGMQTMLLPVIDAEDFQQQFQSILSGSLSQALRTGDVQGALTGFLDQLTGTIVDNFANNLSTQITSGLFGGNQTGGNPTNFFGNLFGGGGGGSGGGFLSNIFGSLFGGGGGLGSLFGGIGSLFGGFFGFNQGGVVPNVNPFNLSGPDTVPALLQPNEVVIPEDEVGRMNGDTQVNNVTVNLEVVGNVDMETRRNIIEMIPEIAGGVNIYNAERGI